MLNKHVLRQSYDQYAEERDKSDLAPWKEAEREAFLSLVKQEGKKSLLEIGAGTGRDSLYFAENGLSVVATDFSVEMVARCLAKGLDARSMDFYALEFPPSSFEAVYALNCLLHVPKADLTVVFEGIRKVLRPGGLFFCGLYGGRDSEGIWEEDFYEPKRFFAMYRDSAIVKAAERHFEVVNFHTVPMGERAPHFQSLTLRK
ncbi:class I SAM-dependent methyltransferase [Paenibacillus arenilitoris]|uniref:Class I SAM-dependent methyltransferase n=1 Tax=Paenibacillus arenilitoris TaxID=2772299 RepID=A0A927CQH9_9BACL|nr:class I SAM-dependent methyltransferase [Paenibacillus arenilitoris]MBD2872338.1 class I SAM-dependent methyltransferase [Paenibacillus arenilitoris]